MAEITLQVRGLTAMQHVVKTLPKRSKGAVNAAAGKAMFALLERIRDRISGPSTGTRLGRRTGFYRDRSWDVRKLGRGRWQLSTRFPGVLIHEFGGVIRPRNAPFLAFRIGDQFIRTDKVTMPARPHIRPAIKDWSPIANKIYEGEFEKAVKETMRVRGALSQGGIDLG